MFKAAGAAFIRNVNAPEFWSDVREKGSLFVRVACLVHVVRSYGVEATAVRRGFCPSSLATVRHHVLSPAGVVLRMTMYP